MKYMADDGRVFDDYEECKAYEQNIYMLNSTNGNFDALDFSGKSMNVIDVSNVSGVKYIRFYDEETKRLFHLIEEKDAEISGNTENRYNIFVDDWTYTCDIWYWCEGLEEWICIDDIKEFIVDTTKKNEENSENSEEWA